MLNQTIVRVPFVDLDAQYQSIRTEIDAAVLHSVRRGDFILGDDVRLFENEFASFCGAAQAIGVSSGTEALRLALEVCGVGEGDEVITAANTYIATVEAILQLGATPRLVDVSPLNYNIDVVALAEAITPRTKVIVPVHLYGQPVDMAPVLEIARRHNVKVVEDACQAHGARYRGQGAGSIGDLGCFSFYPSKNLGAYGDGGIIVTNNPDDAARLAMLRNHGQREKYYHLVRGWNSRLDTLQASVLRVKLRHLARWNAMRRDAAALYNRYLVAAGLRGPVEEPFAEHVYHLFVVEVEQRDALQEFLRERGIETGIHYPVPIHQQKVYQDAVRTEARYPVAEALARRILSLPFFAEITEEQIASVVSAIASFYAAG